MRSPIIIISLFCCVNLIAQQQKFDLVTYTPPQRWKKEDAESAVQYSKEDAGKGTYCLITLYKSVPGTANAKENFDLAWTSVVKEMVTVSTEPEMQPPTSDKGWELQSGYAPFESDGNKGVVLLVTSTGFEKMVTLIIVTNTNVYEKEVDAFIASVSLKKPAGSTAKKNQPDTKSVKPEETKPVAKQTGFAFTTTNFDDGWTSTVQEDWVQVLKGNIKVLIHYPNKQADAYNSVLMDGLKNAWNILVAPRYSAASNFEFKPITGWQSIEFAEADMVEKLTGKTVHVVLFKMNYSNGSGKYLEFITIDKNAFEQEFGAYHSTSYDWDKTANMQYRNKFSVAANDLIGTWTTSDYASVSYYYVNSGGLAGTSTTSTADEFTFSPGNNYQSQHSGASGEVGNIKFSNQVYKGKSNVSNWGITLTNRFRGATESYDCYFETIKGGRILLMTDRLKTTRALVKK